MISSKLEFAGAEAHHINSHLKYHQFYACCDSSFLCEFSQKARINPEIAASLHKLGAGLKGAACD